MKLLPILLLNVVVAGGAVVIYDQVSKDAPAPTYESMDATDAGLVARIEALESAKAESSPMLQSAGADPRVMARLDELERLFGGAAPAAADQPTVAADDPGDGMAAPAAGTDGNVPGPDEVKRYRKLQQLARQQEREEREMARIDQTLKELDIDLSDKQKEQLGKTYRSFQERRTEMFRAAMTKAREMRDSGGTADWGEVMRETREAVNQEFVSKISSFIPSDDAVKISDSLNTRGPMRGGAAFGRGSRGR